MASTPVITSPADYSTQSLPFDIVGTNDGVLVEARDDAGLLLPATTNPVAVSAGAFTIHVTGTTGNRGAVYATGAGQVGTAGYSDAFAYSDGDLDVVGTGWTKPFSRSPVVSAGKVIYNAGGDAFVRHTGGTYNDNQWAAGNVSRVANGEAVLVLRHNTGTTNRIRVQCTNAGVYVFGGSGGNVLLHSVTSDTTSAWIKASVTSDPGNGDIVRLYGSSDGATWSQIGTDLRNLAAAGGAAFDTTGGIPGLGIASDSTGVAWIDNWSAGNL